MSACEKKNQPYRLEAVAIDALPSWEDADILSGMMSMMQACAQPNASPSHAYGVTITPEQWQQFCDELHLALDSKQDMRRWVVHNMQAYHVTTAHHNTGLLTGYFTPSLRGSLRPSDRYNVPIYGVPDDASRTIYSRAEIDNGALSGQGLEIMWLDNAIDAFFLHIQGSAFVSMDDGTVMTLVFAGKNERPYVPIGAQFVQDGVVAREDMSMQWLVSWLEAHPEEAPSVMQRNPSYIFFALADAQDGVSGAHGSTLSPLASVAIDPEHVDYGIPLWISVPDTAPVATLNGALVVAQDTGSAIKGVLRADLYTGVGEDAKALAGKLQSVFAQHVLFPNTVHVP